MSPTPKKTSNPTDRHVGARVRMRRMILKMSQERLSESLGITFQQVQKYEKGVNRIGASRLQQIANVLQAPVEFFFEGGPAAPAEKGMSVDYIDKFLSSPDGLGIARAVTRIPDSAIRRSIMRLTQQIADLCSQGGKP